VQQSRLYDFYLELLVLLKFQNSSVMLFLQFEMKGHKIKFFFPMDQNIISLPTKLSILHKHCYTNPINLHA